MKTMRIVIAGCGCVSVLWFDALKKRDDAELVGLVDLSREAMDKRIADYGLGGIETGTDLKAVLKKTKPDIVFNCTIPEAHLSVINTALRHGCHVLTEKPLADTMPHAQKIIAAARATGKLCAVMQDRRYYGRIQSLRSFLESGAIGRITTVHCDSMMGLHFGGFRDHMRHVLLVDMAIHTFDQARFITGQDALSVIAHEWNPPGSWYEHEASAVAIYAMTNDIVYTYRGSWCAEGLSGDSWRIIGDKGSLTWDGDIVRAQAVNSDTGFIREMRDIEVPYDKKNFPIEGHAVCINDFIHCVQTGEIPQTVCSDNIKSLAMVHSAIKSSRHARRVTCDYKIKVNKHDQQKH